MLSDDRIISYNMTDNLLTKGIITMNFLEERIMKDGVVKEGNILKVDSFLNHQMDVKLFKQMGEEFKRRFAGKNINKIITIEASGIGIACIVAECFDVPVVLQRSHRASILTVMCTLPKLNHLHISARIRCLYLRSL